eukprot:g4608.t1
MKLNTWILFIIGMLCLTTTVMAKRSKDPKDCEVCIKVLKEVQQKINKGDKESAIEEKIEEYCGQKNLGSYEKKVCYFIKPIKRTVSKPFTFGMTPEEICHRKLKRASADICTVKFPAPIDLSNIKKLRVKQLRQILAEHGETCKNCVEKRQYVEMVEKIVAKQQGGKEL